MKYIVEFANGIDREVVEFHSRSHDGLKEKVRQWMEEDGNFIEGNIYSDAGRFLFNIYL